MNSIRESLTSVKKFPPERMHHPAGSVRCGDFPYSATDVTCGIENEFQTAVSGKSSDVDLPGYIRDSNYLKNLLRRIERGEIRPGTADELNEYLSDRETRIWENSWVRFPLRVLSPFAADILKQDLKSDKSRPDAPDRGDSGNFLIRENGSEYLRVPVSYLLKLALADSIDGRTYIPPCIRNTGISFLSAFLNDNTSPEIISFFPVRGDSENSCAENIRNQTLKSYLLTQMLVLYSNMKFELALNGQEVSVYFSPHPPVKQKKLNDLITDSFYRELYMSPCLSGWDRGEEKHSYMNLCHQVLSRSSLNSILKLRESGIISGERVYLKGISNISLANNGTHISIGSRRLTGVLKSGTGAFNAESEKYFGDLAIKIIEHFIPLFTGTYSASPYRIGYGDFHPEKVLGFLAHEMDFTHLRMLWRKWQRKADIGIFGNPVLPFGPDWYKKFLSGFFRLRGDYTPDYRMIDFPVSFLSTDESPLFNGMTGNDERLKKDLTSLGIFDSGMSVYTLYRMRSLSSSGFTGFEGRYYSLFESLEHDLRGAADMQMLITSLAWKYIIEGSVTHNHIPDTSETESERRQIIFAASAGINSFYVRKDTPNLLLKKILSAARNTRTSRRYPSYLRVGTSEYLKALFETIRNDAAEIIETSAGEILKELELRLDSPHDHSASGKLTSGILKKGGAPGPLSLSAEEFNLCAEEYYRNELRMKHMNEGFDHLIRDIETLGSGANRADHEILSAIKSSVGAGDSADFIKSMKWRVADGSISLLYVVSMIHLILALLYKDMKNHSALEEKQHL